MPVRRTAGGHRRYGDVPGVAGSRRTVCSARVSCADQRDDLERQKARLAAYAEAQGWGDAEVMADLGSGMNHTKPGLLRRLGLLLRGEIGRLVVETRDRLRRCWR